MHRTRRVVTLVTALSLLQLVLLGSGVPCVTPMVDAGPHAAHAAGHDEPAHTAMAEHRAGDAGQHEQAPATDCGVRACTISPITVAASLVVMQALPRPVHAFPALDESPASPVPALDPPPPRV